VLHVFEPVVRPVASSRFQRSPAVPIACAVMFGIVVDRLSSLSLASWLLLTSGIVLFAAVSMALRWRTVAAAWLLLGCLGMGATWHHWYWSCLAENDVSAWATERGQLIRLQAKVVQAPLIVKVPDAEHVP